MMLLSVAKKFDKIQSKTPNDFVLTASEQKPQTEGENIRQKKTASQGHI